MALNLKTNEDVFTGMLCGVFLAVFILIVSSLFWSSQPPSPRPPKGGQKQKQHSAGKDQIWTDAGCPTQFRPSAIDQHDASPNATHGDEQASQDNPEPPLHWWHDPITLFTAILASAAVIQLLIYGTQACYMYRGLKVTEKTLEQMRLEQRAWLSITATITKLEVGLPLGVEFNFANSGRTPAMIHKVKIGAQIHSDYMRIDFDQIVTHHTSDRPWEPRENTVAPNNSYDVPLNDGPVVTQTEFDSLGLNQKGILYFLVTVQYSDIAGGRESQALLTYTLDDRFRQWQQYNYMK